MSREGYRRWSRRKFSLSLSLCHVHQQNPLKKIIIMKLPLHPALQKSNPLPHSNFHSLKFTSQNTTPLHSFTTFPKPWNLLFSFSHCPSSAKYTLFSLLQLHPSNSSPCFHSNLLLKTLLIHSMTGTLHPPSQILTYRTQFGVHGQASHAIQKQPKSPPLTSLNATFQAQFHQK